MNKQLKHYQQRLEQQLKSQLGQWCSDLPSKLEQAILYASLTPGKRLRPALTYAVAEALERPLEQVDPAACAIELIHSYSLVHDDLPAMDDDDLRRGQPTCHKQFDEATAILTGDAQQTLAFQILSQTDQLSANQKVRSIQILCQASGASGMIAGQVLDIQHENQTISLEQLTQMHQRKTGALIQASLLLGAATHSAFDQYQACLSELGQALGLAFQIQDDILDIEADTLTLGKTQGRDIALNKSTFPKLLGLDAAKALRDDYIQQAHDCHHQLGFQSAFLHDLINYIAERRY